MLFWVLLLIFVLVRASPRGYSGSPPFLLGTDGIRDRFDSECLYCRCADTKEKEDGGVVSFSPPLHSMLTYITPLMNEVSSFSINHVQSSFSKPFTNIILLSFYMGHQFGSIFHFCCCRRGDGVPSPPALSALRGILARCNDVHVIIVDF